MTRETGRPNIYLCRLSYIRIRILFCLKSHRMIRKSGLLGYFVIIM